MPKDGAATKELILNSAQELVYERGFSATTLDLMLERAKLTKGAFFHHFKNKDDLALSLIERYLDGESVLLNSLVERAEQLTRDPLQQVLIIIGFIIDDIKTGGALSKGCLFASYAFELAEFDENVRSLARKGFTKWREVIGGKVAQAMEMYKPKLPVSSMDLTENMLAAFEGGIVIFRMEGNPDIIAKSLSAFRNYVELLFDQRT
ncbi:MAG: TetR/AcrR family transcriptional regulator [Rhodospirillaceae bacterium]|nr:TetR/AcrR family transcriptional regulator [Rhodospirillaceae bacterium]